MQGRQTRVLMLWSSIALIVFCMGFLMGSEDIKTKINDAFRSGDTKATIHLFLQCQNAGEDVAKNPLYWVAIAKSMAKRGDLVGVRFNLDKAAELLVK